MSQAIAVKNVKSGSPESRVMSLNPGKVIWSILVLASYRSDQELAQLY